MQLSTLDEFLQFYSQADAGNGLTRGLETELAKQTYVKTVLDEKLTPDVLAGKFRLVVLTGNAGDGKTALIQTVEREAEAKGASLQRVNGIGCEFTLDGKSYRTLYDGSVDCEGGTNAEMLTDFFKSLEGDEEPGSGPCLIVAMNEGKLRDFLGKSTSHQWLSHTLLGHLLDDKALPQPFVVVNLNMRSVVDAASTLGSCLLDRILDRYVANEFWEPCQDCPARLKCPVKFNVDTFRVFDPSGLADKDREATEARNAVALAARRRLKALLQVLHFRKRLHVTVRDLRSLLAFALFGKKTCSQIQAEIQQGEADFTDRYYYNAIFSESERDRVIGFLREFDVGKTATPQIDSRLSFTRPKTPEFRRLFLDFENTRVAHAGRTRIDEDDLARLFAKRPRSPEERSPEVLALARQYVVSARRKLFFEGSLRNHLGEECDEQQTIWSQLLPYDNLEEFMAFVDSGHDARDRLKGEIVEGISRSEGIHDGKRSKENVCIRTRQDTSAKVKAFFTYPNTDFAIELPKRGAQAQYVEYLPTNIRFRHAKTAVVLEISLDLFEMLMRIRDGYVATAGEMRAFFLNLLMFKKQLMALPAKELLLTETDYEIFKLTRTPQNGVALSSL